MVVGQGRVLSTLRIQHTTGQKCKERLDFHTEIRTVLIFTSRVVSSRGEGRDAPFVPRLATVEEVPAQVHLDHLLKFSEKS